MSTSQNLPPAIFLMGPTASGKTAFSEMIASDWPVEIISVDSALIYRGMDIGTAKPSADFLNQLPHFLIDIRNPDEAYSAANFRVDALELMQAIHSRGNIPLLVGGTMLYFKVLLEGMADLPETDADVRASVLKQAEAVGWPAMHQKLLAVDPETANSLHPNHSQRIQRALEVYELTGEALSSIQARQQAEPLPFNLLQLALWPADREQLHSRIAQRFEQMLQQGFLDEVRSLRARYPQGDEMTSMRAVGYRQAWEHIEGRIDYNEFIAQGLAATRQLAKRQFTWLRKWQNFHKLEMNFQDQMLTQKLNRQIYSKIEALVP